MTSLAKAVKQTLAYSRSFGLPLPPEKLHLWLITSRPVTVSRLKPYFSRLSASQKKLLATRTRLSAAKHRLASRAARLLALFPTIRLVCTTGSLAVDNATANDDIDIMIVTRPNTLWLTRLLVVALLRLLGWRRPTSRPEHHSPMVKDKICDNLWLDETALALPNNKRNLYTAHEVLQARPVFDRGGVHARFLLANAWTKKYLANAYLALTSKNSRREKPAQAGRLVRFLNRQAFSLQHRYMRPKITRETITLHAAYFHPNDPTLTIKSGGVY